MKHTGRWKSIFFLVISLALICPEQTYAAENHLILPSPAVLLHMDLDQMGTVKKTSKTDGEQAETILIKTETDQLTLGKEYQFQVSCYPKTVGDVPVVWESSNSFVASVDSQGLVSAGWEGEAVITVRTTDGSDLSDSKKIQVKKGKVVVLDPGHGGKDSGASNTKYGLVERNINLDIALACRDELEKYDGVTVVMTRTTNGEYPGLSARTKLAYEKKADLFVSLHINDGSFLSSGSEVYQSVNSMYQVTSLAQSVLNNLSDLGMKNRGVKTRRSQTGNDYYAVIRGCAAYKIPGIIIEHGFISSASDAAKMDTKTERESMGKADAQAIASYFQLSKTDGTD
jgi:N-acetylmuramoyl-L-alanine amidase